MSEMKNTLAGINKSYTLKKKKLVNYPKGNIKKEFWKMERVSASWQATHVTLFG